MKISVKRLVLWHFWVALAAVFVGVVFGLLQVLSRAGIYVISPQVYYQGLTFHGVLNAVVFTTFFIVAFFYVVTETSLRVNLNRKLAYASFFTMLLGTLLAGVAMLDKDSAVLYTFYPPLKAPPHFYIGATLLVVGSWIAVLNTALTFMKWRRLNPGSKTPLPMVAVIATYAVWMLATTGIAIEVLFFLIPWSLGLLKGVNPELARTLFWWFGHPLVYFWLLPAYLAWYFILPRVAGGKLYSGPAARLVFIMFIVFSTPVGTHHQFMDPGISNTWKAVQGFLTFMVAVPSLITAFTLAASLEYAAWLKGARGLFSWWLRLPWGNHLFAGMISGMIAFVFGGISGIVNASYNLNAVVHNTSWIPGHFHLTVGTAVFLTFLAMMYYLTEKLTGKEVWSPKLATIHFYMWLLGVLVFSWGMMQLGRVGIPRRTNLGLAPYVTGEETLFMAVAAIGGILMFTSALLFFLNYGLTLMSKPVTENETVELDYAEEYHKEEKVPSYMDNWKLWIGLAVVLVVVTYAPVFYDVLRSTYTPVGGFSPFGIPK